MIGKQVITMLFDVKHRQCTNANLFLQKKMVSNKIGFYGEEYFTMKVYNRDIDIEWVSMDFQVPVNAILREYNSIKNSLNIQRPEYDHTGML